jgi:hypothetical protein
MFPSVLYTLFKLILILELLLFLILFNYFITNTIERRLIFFYTFNTRQPKIGNNEWWLPKSRGSQAWSTAQDSESCPVEVREFKSRPLHLLF